MLVLTKEEKNELVKKGWFIKDNTIITRDNETKVVEFHTLRPSHKIEKLIYLTRKSFRNAEDYVETMCEIAKLEKELKLYDKNNEEIRLY